MKKTITYNLATESYNSDQFYNDLYEFSSCCFEQNYKNFSGLIKNYSSFLKVTRKGDIRSPHEYIFELLSIGVYWINYGEYSVASSRNNLAIMHGLYNLRRKFKAVKSQTDLLRGILTPSKLLKMNDRENLRLNNTTFRKLILWLKATGEFREEAARLDLWCEFFITACDKPAIYFTKIVSAAHSFISQANHELSRYTYNVENYLTNSAPLKKGKEDYLFCSRKVSDYHLSMVGAELMNIAFRENFLKTSKKVLLLPACMKSAPRYCKAKRETLDSTCTGCDQKCAINKYHKMEELLGFEVHIIPHSTDFSNWLKTWAVGKDIGVIGVACILNLITGGLEMRDLNIPAQCLFLDYCGCSAHWDEQGIPTEINETRLKYILSRRELADNKAAM